MTGCTQAGLRDCCLTSFMINYTKDKLKLDNKDVTDSKEQPET